MSGFFDRMRRGDRAALGELLALHGAALQRLCERSKATVSPSEVIHALWKASIVAPRNVADRAFALSVVTEVLAVQTLAETAAIEENVGRQSASLDLATLSHIAARVAAEIAEKAEVELLEEMCRAHRVARSISDRIRSATKAAKAVPQGPSQLFDEAWIAARFDLE